MKKMICMFIITLILMGSLSVSLATVDFTDINEHWAKNEIKLLVEKGIINGYADNTFKPDESIAVNAFIKLVVVSLAVEITANQEDWSKPYIEYALKNGILKDGEIIDNTKSISRYEMAMVLYRALKLSSKENIESLKVEIKDFAEIPNDFSEFVLNVYAIGLIKGDNNGNFGGNLSTTRAQAAIVIKRLIDYIKAPTQEEVKESVAQESAIPTVPQKPGLEIFISNLTGDDINNDGTKEAPFQTIQRARDEIRKIKAKGGLPKGGIIVNLRSGTYFINKTIEFTGEDSGEIGSPIVYKAYGKEKVTLSGGQKIEFDWIESADKSIQDRIIDQEAAKKVVQINLKEHNITNYGELSRFGFNITEDIKKDPQMQLYIDGDKQILSRWPNNGTHKMLAVTAAGPKKGEAEFTTRGGSFTVDYDRPTKWQDLSDIWLEGIFSHSWAGSHNKLATFDTTKKEVTLAYGEVYGVLKAHFTDDHYYRNVLEELDMPGEYYIDKKNGKLYMIPPKEIDGKNKIVLSALDNHMINALDVSNIIFKDILFEYGRKNALVFEKGSNILIDSCEMRYFDGNVISMSKVWNSGVTRCNIHHFGSAGITMDSGDYDTLAYGNSFIENNEIHDNGYYIKVYNNCIWLSGVGNRVSNNKLYNTTHAVVSVQGNDQIFEYNEIFNVCTDFSDMGAYYINTGAKPQQRGQIVRYNYFHDFASVLNGQQAFYLDCQSYGTEAYGNIFARIGNNIKDNNAILLNSASDTKIYNNIFIECASIFRQSKHAITQTPQYLDAAKKVMTANNSFKGTAYEKKYPELMTFFDRDFTIARDVSFTSNLHFNQKLALHPNKGFVDEFNDMVVAKNNYYTNKNPGFVDYLNNNYMLKENAEVFNKIKDFKPIPFDKIGLKTKTGRFADR